MVFPPAIPFHPKPKKKADDEKEDETKTVTFKVTLGRGEDETNAQKTEWSFRVFEDDGDAEEYVKWRIRFEELAEAMQLDTPEKKYKVLQQALRGEARARFNTAWHSVEIPTNVSPGRFQVMSEKRLKKGYNALAKQLFVPVDSAWRRQRSYLRYHVKFGNMTVAEFRRRLIEQNEFLKYFPAPAGKSVSKLTEEELVEIVDRAKPVEYHCDVLANNYDPYQKTLQEYTEYLERLEVKHNIQKAMAKRDNQQVQNDGDESGGRKNRKRKHKNGGKRHGNTSNNNNNNGNCELCGKPGHNKVDCWEDDKNASKRPPGYKTGKNRRNRQTNRNNNELPRLTAEQMSFLMQGFEALKRNEASKKRRVRVDENDDDHPSHTHFLAQTNSKVDAESDNNTSDYNSDDYINDYNRKYVFVTSHQTKKQKTTHLSTEVVGQFCDARGEIFPMRVLFDTGSTSTIVLRKFAKSILPG